MVDRGGGHYVVSYVPLTAGLYTLMLRYGGQPAAGFPATVDVLPAVDTSKVKVFGPGVDDKGRGAQPTDLTPPCYYRCPLFLPFFIL